MMLLIAALLAAHSMQIECPATLTYHTAVKARPFAQEYADCLRQQIGRKSQDAKVLCSAVRSRQLSLAARSLPAQQAVKPFDWIDYTNQFLEDCETRIVIK